MIWHRKNFTIWKRVKPIPFLICEDLPLLRGNPGTPPRTLSYPGPPTRCLWGCVYWPSPVASPRQFYKRKKHNLLKLCHTKPFLQNIDRVIEMFSLQDNSGEKIRQASSLSDTVVLKKNGDKIGQILFSRTILNQLILSNLNLSMPYKTGLYKTERQSQSYSNETWPNSAHSKTESNFVYGTERLRKSQSL